MTATQITESLFEFNCELACLLARNPILSPEHLARLRSLLEAIESLHKDLEAQLNPEA
jgi:hypothetical protein